MSIYSKRFESLFSNANGHVKGEILTEHVLRFTYTKNGQPSARCFGLPSSQKNERGKCEETIWKLKSKK